MALNSKIKNGELFLKELPVFGREQIEEHVKKSGKCTVLSSNKESVPIAETLKQGTRFQEERYLSSDNVYTRVTGQEFQIKSRCRASMSTREVHNQEVNLQLSSGDVLNAKCTCKTGKSSYCNHVMALPIEIADYYLHQLAEVPEEAACTERARSWGIPGERDFPKESVLVTSIQKHMSSRGINPTLYDPRIGGTNKLNFEKVAKLQESLSKINSSIGFAHVIPSLDDDLKFTNTKFGPQAVGSPLAYHLAPTPFNFEIKADLLGMESICPVTEKDFVNVPLFLVNSHRIDSDKVYSD